MNQQHLHDTSLECLVIFPDDYEEGVPLIVCLHGYGADMHDLADLPAELHRSGYLYVLPNAPLAAFEGADRTARAWYERGGDESPETVRETLAVFDTFMNEVRARFAVQPGQVLLLGFSQGGAVALRYGLPRPKEVAALAVLSGSLRRLEDLEPTLPATKRQAIFITHGRADAVVPPDWSRKLADFLERQGYRPTFRLYAMGHQIRADLVRDLKAWISRTLPRS